MRLLIAIIFSGLLSIHTSSASAEEFLNGVIVRVSDGDTATVLTSDDKQFSIRFYGIDAPETKNSMHGWPAQPFSAESKKFASKMIDGKIVSIRLKGEVTYGRLVGEIFVDGRSVNRELVRKGLAWWNKPYAKDDLDLARLAKKARGEKIGLWSDDNPTSPWDWRNNKGFSAALMPDAQKSLNELRKQISDTE